MSDLPVRPRPRIAVPTGYQLLALVRAQGALVLKTLRDGPHVQYLREREFYLELLSIAQNDEICAAILIPEAQAIFDEESRAHHDRVDKAR